MKFSTILDFSKELHPGFVFKLNFSKDDPSYYLSTSIIAFILELYVQVQESINGYGFSFMELHKYLCSYSLYFPVHLHIKRLQLCLSDSCCATLIKLRVVTYAESRCELSF
jgi:hypothetical protein